MIFKTPALFSFRTCEGHSARLVLKLAWVLFRITLPIILVGCVLVLFPTRQEYIFYASLPSMEQRPTYLRFRDNLTERSHWNEFVMRERPGLFQNVTKDGLALVFSAYLDDMKNSKKIRGIGAKLRSYTINISCAVWYSLSKSEGEGHFGHVIVPGYVTEHIEVFERSWAQVHYMCDLGDLPTNPYAVSIIAEEGTMPPLNLILVKYTAEDSTQTYTVCLHNAFNFRSDVSTEIVEWVELNRILGADHFMIYNYSSHIKNDQVLKWYENQGLVTLIQWDLPTYVDLIFIGQVAVMTDCLYRNFYRSTFISHLDLDEYIVPRRPGVTTVPELLSVLPSRCGYIARCAVFSVADGYSDKPFVGKEIADRFKLNTLLTRKRQTKIWGSKDRSKQLMRTSCVEMAGVHRIDGYTSIVSEMTFDPSDALMHHYRRGRPRFVKNGEKIEDNFMLTHASKLIENVSRTWENIEVFNRLNRSLTNVLI